MLAVARFVMKGPSQAVLVAAGFGVLSFFPIFFFVLAFSGGAIALVALRQGVKQGVFVTVGAAIAASLLMTLVQGDASVAWILVMAVWVPALILALVLRHTESWASTLAAAIGVGFFALVVVYLALGDPKIFWQSTLTELFDLLATQAGPGDMAALQEQIPALSEWLTGFMVAVVMLAVLASVMLARWWQSSLYNPGGFRREFYGLCMHRETSIAVLVVLTLSLVASGLMSEFVSDILLTVMVIYAVAGLGLVHCAVAATGRSTGWLVALYAAMLLVLPHVVAILSALGFSDSWVNFRARLPQAADSSVSKRDDE